MGSMPVLPQSLRNGGQAPAQPNRYGASSPGVHPFAHYTRPTFVGQGTRFGGQIFDSDRYVYWTPQQIQQHLTSSGQGGLLSDNANDFTAYVNWYNQNIAPLAETDPNYDALLSGVQPFNALDYANGANPYVDTGADPTGNDAIQQSVNDLIASLGSLGSGQYYNDPALEQRLAVLESGQQQQGGIPPELLIALLANQGGGQQDDQMYSGQYYGGYY